MSEQTKGRTWAETPYFDKEFDLYQFTETGTLVVSADGLTFYGKEAIFTYEATPPENLLIKADLTNMPSIKSPVQAASAQTAVIGALTYHVIMVQLPEALAWEKAHNEYVADATIDTAARLVLAANAWFARLRDNGSPVMGETPEQSADPEFLAQRDTLLMGDLIRGGVLTLELDEIGEKETE